VSCKTGKKELKKRRQQAREALAFLKGFLTNSFRLIAVR